MVLLHNVDREETKKLSAPVEKTPGQTISSHDKLEAGIEEMAYARTHQAMFPHFSIDSSESRRYKGILAAARGSSEPGLKNIPREQLGSPRYCRNGL